MSERTSEIALQAMQAEDVDAVCALIAMAMNADEAAWARRSFAFHFAARAQGLDDGRQYFIRRHQGRLAVISGLHHYDWGPAENVWLAWFAVHPDLQRQGIGRHVLTELEAKACELGYRKFFIETYDHPDFAKAQDFYAACGFEARGRIPDYLPGSEAMLVYVKMLACINPPAAV